MDRDHHLVYCPIEKVGSSFWKRVFSILKHRGTTKRQLDSNISVFNLSGVGIHRKGKLDKLEPKSLLSQHYDLVQSFKAFLFVRDPYERLFSGYIDKFFTPTFETGSVSRDVLRTAYLRPFLPGRRSARRDHIPHAQREGLNRRSGVDAKVSSPAEAIAFSFKRHETDSKPGHSSGLDNVEGNSSIETPRHGYYEELSYGNEENRAREITRSFLNHDDFYDDDSIGYDYGRSHDDHFPHRRGSLRGLGQRRRAPRVHFSDRFQRPGLCRLNVTFAQFVRHVINGVLVNEHFKPMSNRCPPCFLRYDFVGKLETFKEDVNYILTSAGVDPADVIGADSSFDHDSDVNILRDVTERTFSVMRKYEVCMTRVEMLRRTWITFQVGSAIRCETDS